MLTQATHLTAQTNTAYHKMGHLIGAAKRWDISAAYCAHTSNTSNSTNKHSLSQDGSSDRSRQEMGHLSSILCSHKQHIYHSTNKHSLSQDGSDTSRQKMGHLSSILCSHTQHKHSHQDVGAAKANRSLQRDVQLMCPILPLMGLGLQITTPFLHGMHKTLVCFNWES